jgi:hypothetical protein
MPGPPGGRPSRTTIAIAAGIGVLVIAGGVIGGVVATREGAGSGTGTPLPGLLTGPAPWGPNTTELRARLEALGLPALPAEAFALHIHQHLDVFVDGKRVTVPANIGINFEERFLSPLHTHDPSGIIHVESPTVRTFTLGQFFGVWGVRFTRTCLGGYCASGAKKLRVFVNGAPVPGDPGKLPLAAHQEIVVAYGTRADLPQPLPSSYQFPAGL